MKTLLIGTGAIGGTLAAAARDAGHDITVVCRPAAKEKISTEGFALKGILGEKKVSIPAAGSVGELGGKFDFVLIATKAYDMPALARDVLPLLKEDSLVVSVQNGICVDALADVVGRDRTVGCMIGFGATLLSPTEAEVTSTGEFIIGKLTEAYKDKLTELQKIMSAGLPCEITDKIYEELYSKLIVNSCITSLGALCGLKLGEMLKKKFVRDVFIEIIFEAMKVAGALKLNVPPFGGKLNYYKFVKGFGFMRHLIIKVVGKKYRNLKSSSLQSLERGKPTEIDYFNGYISAKGKEVGVPTPVNDKIVAMIKEIEAGKRRITLDNFKELK